MFARRFMKKHNNKFDSQTVLKVYITIIIFSLLSGFLVFLAPLAENFISQDGVSCLTYSVIHKMFG